MAQLRQRIRITERRIAQPPHIGDLRWCPGARRGVEQSLNTRLGRVRIRFLSKRTCGCNARNGERQEEGYPNHQSFFLTGTAAMLTRTARVTSPADLPQQEACAEAYMHSHRMPGSAALPAINGCPAPLSDARAASPCRCIRSPFDSAQMQNWYPSLAESPRRRRSPHHRPPPSAAWESASSHAAYVN